MKAWHFTADKLRDGRDIPQEGIALKHEGELELCKSGLHSSARLIDALQYAPDSIICRVECGGEIIQGKDKLVCSQRTILWRVDAGDLLWDFSRWCAHQVIDGWDCPNIVRKWIETGDEKVRGKAYSAARSPAYSATYSVDDSAAYSAANSAACAAAYLASKSSQNTQLEKMVNELHEETYEKWTT